MASATTPSKEDEAPTGRSERVTSTGTSSDPCSECDDDDHTPVCHLCYAHIHPLHDGNIEIEKVNMFTFTAPSCATCHLPTCALHLHVCIACFALAEEEGEYAAFRCSSCNVTTVVCCEALCEAHQKEEEECATCAQGLDYASRT